MRNLELKARCADLVRAEEIALQLGATPSGTQHQLDTYFHTPGGRLKLRQINHADGELIYYERREDSAVRWSNYYTAPVADCAAVCDVLTLAYGVRLQVEKSRTLYLYGDARIHMDRVEGLGSFVEFEAPVRAESDGEHERARSIVSELMFGFGLHASDAIATSYADLLENEVARARLPANDPGTAAVVPGPCS